MNDQFSQPHKKEMSASAMLVTLFVVAGLLALWNQNLIEEVFGLHEGKIVQTRSQKAAVDLSLQAMRLCEDRVRSRLKSPSSAKFPWDCFKQRVTKNHITPRKYFTMGCYDAQNAFGAMLRGNYVCTVEQKGAALKVIVFALE